MSQIGTAIPQPGGLSTRLLKLECVVGENTGEASVESRILLSQRAKKIADIHARLLDLSADVVDSQVMVQGILHKQIFFVGEDDRVHHQAEDVPFATFVDVPGAGPGMSAIVQGRIAKLTHQLSDMQELIQRAILQFFVKTTDSIPVRWERGKHPFPPSHAKIYVPNIGTIFYILETICAGILGALPELGIRPFGPRARDPRGQPGAGGAIDYAR